MRLALRRSRRFRTVARALALCVGLFEFGALQACGRIGFTLSAVTDAAPPSIGDAAARSDASIDASAGDGGGGAVGGMDAQLPDAASMQDAGSSTGGDASSIGTGTPMKPDAAVDGGADAAAITKLARGFTHMCAIMSGDLFCWGNNNSAQLGLGDTADRLVPTRHEGRWLDACGTEESSCGIQADGALYCWGDNTKGELGLGDRTARKAPTRVGTDNDWAQVSCIGLFVCALRNSGALYCWGENSEGAPGQADASGSPDVLTPSVVAEGTTYRMVSAGQGSVCAIDTGGALYCWGRNTQAQLGLGSTTMMQVRKPTRVGTLSDWKSVAAGQEQTLAVREDGSLWSWGIEAEGARGLTTLLSPVVTPTRVTGVSNWKQITSARLGSCGVTEDGALYCWGRGVEGQIGNGTTTSVRTPTRVGDGQDWREVRIGYFFACGLRSDASVWCWGENFGGMLGLDDTSRRSSPEQVMFPAQ